MLKTLRIDYHHFKTKNELELQHQKLIERAIINSFKAYAPYSSFHVGAAVLLANGEVIDGSNQENAAYPSGMCAERVALFSANANYPDYAVKTVAIAATQNKEVVKNPLFPCGACRQVLAETEMRFKAPIQFISYTSKDIFLFDSIKKLLPFEFYF